MLLNKYQHLDYDPVMKLTDDEKSLSCRQGKQMTGKEIGRPLFFIIITVSD